MPLQEVGDKGGTEGRFSLHGVLEASSVGTLIPSISSPLFNSWASLVAQLVKNPPAMQETWVRSLDWEDPLKKGKATHSSMLAWRIPRTVCTPWGRKELFNSWSNSGLLDTLHVTRRGLQSHQLIRKINTETLDFIFGAITFALQSKSRC